MFFLITLVLIIIIYIVSFKENFTKEHIDKAAPVIIIFTVAVLLICIVNSYIRSR